MQKILTRREKIILYLTTGVFFSALIFKFVLIKIINRNEILNKEIGISQLKLNKYRWLLQQKDQIQNKYGKLSSPLKESGQQDSLVGALADLESLAQNANIRIIDIRPQTPKNLDLYQELVIELRAEGTIEGFLNFVYNLEAPLSLLKIKRFRLAAKPNSSILEGSFSISRISPF